MNADVTSMKMMIIIVRADDADNVVSGFVGQGLRVTRMSSTGGFLKRGNVTLLVGVAGEKVDGVMELLKRICCPSDNPDLHRATVFVTDMPFFAQI
jgi:uncharacterized protein YaaQ